MAEQENSPKKDKGKSAPVVNYISLLLLASFLLLFMTFLMENRQSEEMLDSLRSSVSAMQSVENLYEENADLLEETARLQQELYKEQQEHMLLKKEMEKAEQQIQMGDIQVLAMDWFWQIDEAYVLKRNELALNLILSVEQMNLDAYLPYENLSDTERFSPAHRYAEIKQALEFKMPEED